MTATVITTGSSTSCAATPPPPPPLSPRVMKSPSSVRKFPGDIPSSMKSASSVCSFSTNSTCSHGRRVNFSPLVKVKDTISHRDMTLKEHYTYWLQDHEFLMIRQRNQRLVLQVEEFQDQQKKFGKHRSSNSKKSKTTTTTRNEAFETTCQDECIRGLESALRSENLRRKSYRFAALEEVLFEQEQQYYGGYFNEEAIAEAYFEVTGECRFRAEYLAVQDRKEIEDYIREDTAALCRQKTFQSSLISDDEDEDMLCCE